MKGSFEEINIKNNEWEKAKMLLFILEPDNISKQRLKHYVEILKNRCLTGKELYAKALISQGDTKKNILQESFDKGYEKAGLLLLEMYEKGNKNVNLLSLANALVPEACMIVANQKMDNNRNRRYFVDLSDYVFTYYKIAASRQYAPAIGKIVDIVFESRFSSGFQIPKNDLDNEKYEEMKNNGHVICQLCRFLISKLYNVDRYSEILGIVLFSLNENLSDAMSLLANANSPLAYYCVGNMYEFGGGVAIDLDQAINNYTKAINKGFEGKAKKRLEACYGKKSRHDYKKNSDEYYHSSKSYRSTSTSTGSYSEYDTCFAPGTRILMADRTYKCVEKIKEGDKVLAYDHYKGAICEEIIVANVHDIAKKGLFNTIDLYFEKDKSISIVKSHALFDITYNKYVWIDDSNVEEYIGHAFAIYKNGKIESATLLRYSMKKVLTNYYMPLSRYHLNVFAEDLLTIPPSKLTVNLFNIGTDMRYDLSIVEKLGKLSYDKIKNLISFDEYSVLPCEYLNSVLYLKKCNISDFEYIMNVYRNQKNI